MYCTKCYTPKLVYNSCFLHISLLHNSNCNSRQLTTQVQICKNFILSIIMVKVWAECVISNSEVSLFVQCHQAYSPSEILLFQPLAEFTVLFYAILWLVQFYVLSQCGKNLSLQAIANKLSINIFLLKQNKCK